MQQFFEFVELYREIQYKQSLDQWLFFFKRKPKVSERTGQSQQQEQTPKEEKKDKEIGKELHSPKNAKIRSPLY